MTTNAGASDLAKPPMGFNRSKREGEDSDAVNRMFTPEFRNRLDAVVGFAGLPQEIIIKVVEKFIFQLEAQLADRSVTIEMTEAATKWVADKGYDEKFGARPLARTIQEYIKKPLADELLFGRLENGGTVRILVKGTGEDSSLDFEFLPADPAKKSKAKATEDDEDDGDSGVGDEEALVGATPKRALPGPKDKRGGSDRPRTSGTVPTVPRRRDD
jgi:ATP-dependent Clp protease ATP-binding subunit ClpA